MLQTDVEIPRPKTQIWKAWPTIGLAIAIFAIYSVVQAIILVVVHIATSISQPGFGLTQFQDTLMTDGLALSISTIISAIVGVVLILVFIKARRGLSFAEYLGLRSISKKTILVALSIPIGLTLLSELLASFFIKSSEAGFMVDAYRNAGSPALFWIAMVIFAPAFEEAFFRGFLFVGLKESRIGAVGAIILTAIIWAALHVQYDLAIMAIIFFLGVVMGIVRLKTGSLWSTYLMHVVWNLLAMIGTVIYLTWAS